VVAHLATVKMGRVILSRSVAEAKNLPSVRSIKHSNSYEHRDANIDGNRHTNGHTRGIPSLFATRIKVVFARWSMGH